MTKLIRDPGYADPVQAFSIIATCNSLTFNVPEDTQVDITKLELSRLGQDYCMMEDYTVYRAGRVVVCLGLRSGTNHLLYAYNEKEDVVVMLAQAMTKEKKIPKSIRFGINTRLYFGRDHLKLCDEALKLLLVHVPGEYLWSDTWSYRFWRGMFSLGLFALPHKETILIPHPRERYCVDLPSNPEAWVRGKKMRKYGNSFQLSVNMDFEMDLTVIGTALTRTISTSCDVDRRSESLTITIARNAREPGSQAFVAIVPWWWL